MGEPDPRLGVALWKNEREGFDLWRYNCEWRWFHHSLVILWFYFVIKFYYRNVFVIVFFYNSFCDCIWRYSIHVFWFHAVAFLLVSNFSFLFLTTPMNEWWRRIALVKSKFTIVFAWNFFVLISRALFLISCMYFYFFGQLWSSTSFYHFFWSKYVKFIEIRD